MNNLYLTSPSPLQPKEGIVWPEHRVLPYFANTAPILDAVQLEGMSPDVTLLFTCLQGLVNRIKPRLFLIPVNASEGRYSWPELLDLKLNEYKPEDKWDIVKKYRDCYEGIVLFSTEKSEHYVNLATTISGLDALLPVSTELLPTIRELFPDLEVKADISSLPYDNAVELYSYVYDNYWYRCSHRLIVSEDPQFRYYNRDLATACGCMVIWTDNVLAAEKDVYKKFLADMEPGNALATGWYTDERSGIGAAAEFGLSTVPSDRFDNTTVYAGMNSRLDIPAIPKMPALENKIYIALYLSDGDNVQYNEHTMLNLWRNPDRGTCPINWTISPALVDFAPAMMNYYYKTATDKDCFVSGPSGLGYSLLIDRHNKLWNLTDRDRTKAYARLTERYLAKTGIHSITVWDEMSEMHTEVYADICRSLYGATMVEWYLAPKLLETMVSGNLAFIPNSPGYTRDINEIYAVFKEKIEKWDRNSPLFISAQGVSWNLTPANIKDLAKKLNEIAPGCIEIVRADHFFALYNEAHGMPYDLCLREGCVVNGGDIDLGGEFEVSRVRFEMNGSCGFVMSGSVDGKNFTTIENCTVCSGGYDFDIPPMKVRYLKIVPKSDSDISKVEVFGK